MKTIKIITGQFATQEAKETLLHMIDSNIKFHKLKNWSLWERFGKTSPETDEIIEDLLKAREQCLHLMQSAEQEKQIKIESTIQISLETEEEEVLQQQRVS